nr:MAG TPA: hypothetical protein [Caudoviricetes sp.]DAT62617.1 MAG TPA: hypothetical protein [Caudoviricetes sp.]
MCPRCKIDAKATRDKEGKTVLTCRNPKCEFYKRILKTLK